MGITTTVAVKVAKDVGLQNDGDGLECSGVSEAVAAIRFLHLWCFLARAPPGVQYAGRK